MATRLGWKSHIDNTVQFILWASFGSAAIHLINIKQAYAERERKLDKKIGILRNVIDRISQGEQVDVASELKVGQSADEREWAELMGAFREDAAQATAERAAAAPTPPMQDTPREALQTEPGRLTAGPTRSQGDATDSVCAQVGKHKTGRFWAS